MARSALGLALGLPHCSDEALWLQPLFIAAASWQFQQANAQSSSTCSRICVAGLSTASSMNGGYVRRDADGEFLHWQHETRLTILEQGTDGRWAFVLEGTVLAESLVAQSTSASNIPFEDVFLTQDGDAIVSFLCCDGGSSGSVGSGEGGGGQDDGSMLLIGALGGAVAFFTVLGFVALAYYSRYCAAAKAASPKAAAGSSRLPVSAPTQDRQAAGRLTPTDAAPAAGGGGAAAYKEVGKGGAPVTSAPPHASPATACNSSSRQSAQAQSHPRPDLAFSSPGSAVRDHQASHGHGPHAHQNLRATATAYSSMPRAPSAPVRETPDADRLLLAEAAEESWQQMLASTWHPQHAAAGEDHGRDRVMAALSASDQLRQDAGRVKSVQLPGTLFPFEVGDRVVLGGFGMPEDTWNGSQGILEVLDLERGRCQVRLEDGRSKAVPLERVLRYAS